MKNHFLISIFFSSLHKILGTEKYCISPDFEVPSILFLRMNVGSCVTWIKIILSLVILYIIKGLIQSLDVV